ncbi:Pyrimidine-specific ribonucleoside hydrolase [Zostera marina]|uniref:Pyrimidine-specific ribonucleoside hydrolase n=1 Tax=Zostera marina TaxID=29655 RepID=A0A0K9NJF0_ZOSMR|nr:Pyrimidine-specific ribonucleoside hydrolase [Zostera marina]
MIDMVVKMLILMGFVIGMGFSATTTHKERPKRVLLDTDVDIDDIFALLYLLKQNRSEIDLKAITINANLFTDPGHSINQIYDVLYMMDRDDIVVGVGGISPNGDIEPNVGGYLPIIEQETSTIGYCRYRQAIPIGQGGRLDTDTNYGLRKSFLPQGERRYVPLKQPTAQQVMKDTISSGPIILFIIGAQTNLALFLMSNPDLKKNIEHIFIMGGGVRSKNPTGCCPKHANTSSSCIPNQCGDRGNLFTAYTSNPYAEFNMFGDPFAAYQVLHSGIPITLVPLDATNTIPINKKVFLEFEKRQSTYEAKYCYLSLKIIHDTWFDDQFYKSYFMWDSFLSGIAVSIIQNGFKPNGENEFAEMEYINITVVTSNIPYGIKPDGSNPFFDNRVIPKFDLKKNGVHSGHCQTSIEDPFCIVHGGNEKGICQDGYTREENSSDAVLVLVAQKAKVNQNSSSPLNRQFFESFLSKLNEPSQSGRFNLASQFPYYREILYKPDFSKQKLGKPVIFDIDMSAGDFLTLIYLLKVPVEIINLKGILISGNGWANAGTIEVVYDILHMMGRDDIPIGLGAMTPLGVPSSSCNYVRAIPHGSGGLIDSDTLFGLARDLPKSPRRYSAENSALYGFIRNTSHPRFRQKLSNEIWESISSEIYTKGRKMTLLTNGPLTNLANIIKKYKKAKMLIQEVYVVGGHIFNNNTKEEGNIFSIPSNQYSEFNFYLDPMAAKIVLESKLSVTMIPLNARRKVSSFPHMLEKLQPWRYETPESKFTYNLISTMYVLQQNNGRKYHHVDMFLGEILGAAFLANDPSLKASAETKSVYVLADGNMSTDGQTLIGKQGEGKPVKILQNIDSGGYYKHFTGLLGSKKQSAVIGSFEEQKVQWSTPPYEIEII